MNKESREFLSSLLLCPSPTGYEQKIQGVIRRYVSSFSEHLAGDIHGNLIAAVNVESGRKVMLAGHCDQIGLMVNHITKEGFIYVTALGGIDVGVLPGAAVTIHCAKGPVSAVVGRKPIHLQKADERGKVGNDLSKIWLDIGARSKREVESLVSIGDPVTFKLDVTYLGKDFISAPGLDDKVGAFISMETVRLCSKAKLSVAVYGVSTVQEEVGLRGAKTSAFSIDPEIGIAIDVAHASDNPAQENTKAVPCKLGGGPCIYRGPNVNPIVEKMLVEAAKKAKIPYQLLPSSAPLGNDANAIQISRGGVAAASIGIPNRYMHTQVEVCSLKDIENASRLLFEFLKRINSKTDFRP